MIHDDRKVVVGMVGHIFDEPLNSNDFTDIGFVGLFESYGDSLE
jgi:hypothetical protein